MWDYILNNKEWIFSGIGVFVLTLIVTYLAMRKKDKKTLFENKNNFNDSPIKNSPITNINADKLNFEQTIINNTKDESKDNLIPITPSQELAEAKKSFVERKTTLRTKIFTVLADRNRTKDSVIQIRNVTDYIEETIGNNYTEVLEELKDLQKEDILLIDLAIDEHLIGPYTRIKLTKKFYSILND